MPTLKAERLYLRALEPEDLELIHVIENDESIWEVSQTQEPYSKFVIKQYLENSFKDIYEVKQLRLVISNYDDKAIGLIDLFEFDPKNKRVGVGILILNKHRGKKYATEAMDLIVGYVFKHLQVHQIYANVIADNKASINLFKTCGFDYHSVKKDWIFEDNNYKDELMFQLIK